MSEGWGRKGEKPHELNLSHRRLFIVISRNLFYELMFERRSQRDSKRERENGLFEHSCPRPSPGHSIEFQSSKDFDNQPDSSVDCLHVLDACSRWNATVLPSYTIACCWMGWLWVTSFDNLEWLQLRLTNVDQDMCLLATVRLLPFQMWQWTFPHRSS